MSVERRQDTIPATGRVEAMRGNVVLLLTSTVAINMRLQIDGKTENFDGVTGGIYIKRVKPFETLSFTGAAGGVITYFIGSEDVDTDETDIRLQVASLTGVSLTQESPAADVVDRAQTTCFTGTTTLFAANLARRRISVITFDYVGGLGNVTFKRIGGANLLLPVQTGVLYQFDGTYGLAVVNSLAGSQTFFIFEEI